MISSQDLIQSEILVLRYKQGDAAAMSELVQIWAGPLYYYIRRFDMSEDDSLEVLQDVWLRVLQKFRQLRRPAAFPAWLFKITRTIVLNRLRRTDRFETACSDECLRRIPQEEGGSGLNGFSIWEIHEALGRLRVINRECLVLRYIQGLSLREISSVLDVPVGTVKSRLYDAKRALRCLLKVEVD